MIIQLNLATFEMDVRGLAMAFFPKEEIQVVFVDGENGVNRTLEEKNLIVYRIEKQIKIEYWENGRKLGEEEETVTEEDRKLQRNQLKRMLYRVLGRCSKKALPWGTLTGIRPTKMVRTALERGVTEADIREDLRKNYYVSEEKQRLMIQIPRTELKALENIPYKQGYSLYAGIPFCPSTCAYCSFTSYPYKLWEHQIDAYLEKLCYEIEQVTELFGEKKLCTIYVGGGTPTTLNPRQLEKLLQTLHKCSNRQPDEITVEAGRPDSITAEKLQVLKENGVTRISINPQTMNQTTLNRIGRRHTVEQTIEAYELARSLGFDNINMDLILGLPGENIDDVRHTMEVVSHMKPDNLTVHSLAIKRAARLRMHQEEYEQYASVNTQEIVDLVGEYAKKLEMVPYYLYRQKNMTGNFENVGYAKKDKISLYNILIMEEMQTIAAAGAGASTKIVTKDNSIIRVENVKEIQNYMDRLDEMLQRKRKALLEADL